MPGSVRERAPCVPVRDPEGGWRCDDEQDGQRVLGGVAAVFAAGALALVDAGAGQRSRAVRRSR